MSHPPAGARHAPEPPCLTHPPERDTHLNHHALAPGEPLPVDGVQVAEVGVLLDAHRASHDPRQAEQTEVAQLLVLVHHQGVVAEQLVAADHRQVGEHLRERRHVLYPVGRPEGLEVLLGLGRCLHVTRSRGGGYRHMLAKLRQF